MKAVLVLDETPENCGDCTMMIDLPDNSTMGDHEYICILSENDIYQHLAKSTSRPNWCPLREMPEYDKPDPYSGWIEDYTEGWNDALRAIEGSGEDD